MTVESSKRYADHLAAEAIERAVHSVTIGYRLTLAGAPPVEVASWHQDPTLELYTVRVRAGDDETTLTVPKWGSRTDEIGVFLRQWITAHVHLEQSKLRKRSRRPDPFWVDAWRRAHPWL
ncbi:hypothetical protein [Brachybacterium alimentarium]|uniref:hypothetical protein n=1 Tax=Brachybacterium alimentarium TaxID=47845 RepID=UPI001178BC8F|nr:hypothetical protein [Brachybacterium alimentarium]